MNPRILSIDDFTSPSPQEGLGIIYENGEWLEDLFLALPGRGVPFDAMHVQDAAFGLFSSPPHVLYMNRVSPSSYLRGNGPAIHYASVFMSSVEALGTRIINGSRSFRLETSKVAQLGLLARLGVHVPRTLVFNNRVAIRDLARGFTFPAILKPDMGGSGAFVRRVRSLEHLVILLEEEADLFGPEHLLLLQEYIPSVDGTVVRTEFLDGEFLYAMRARPTNTFNLCPADSCVRNPEQPEEVGGPPRVEFSHYADIAPEAIAQAQEIVREARLDMGGVEYIETAEGDRYFYDINATSVYRPDICQAAGIDAMGRLVDFVAREYAKELAKRTRPARRSVAG